MHDDVRHDKKLNHDKNLDKFLSTILDPIKAILTVSAEKVKV